MLPSLDRRVQRKWRGPVARPRPRSA